MSMLVVVLLLVLPAVRVPRAAAGCPDTCGGVAISYPFGIGDGCFREGFNITCNGGTPMLAGAEKSVPVSNISITTAEVRVMLPVGWECYNATTDSVGTNWSSGDVQFAKNSVYRISNTHNHLVVLGCNTLGYAQGQAGQGSDYSYGNYVGCMCFCNNSHSAVDEACSGIGCCHVDIPPGLTDNSMTFKSYTHKDRMDYAPCDYAFLVEKENYTFHTVDLRMDVSRTMPVWLDWAIREGDNITCDVAKNSQEYACKSINSECHTSLNGPGYVCHCSMGYDGNPYVDAGCTDIDECDPHLGYPCGQGNRCDNKPGSYDCYCRKGFHSADPFHESCSPNFPLEAQITLGVLGGLFVLAVVVFLLLLQKQKRDMKEAFDKNGGPILEKAKNIKLFRKVDLKPILDDCNFIGKGAFGEVYKGKIGGDNELVAVKKPINVNLAQKEQFANEIIIQSQVIHKNIVRLIGCCLEVDIPILVYEYVPKGSLDDLLHGSSKVHLDLDQRLHIAAGSAVGLAYMHSETNTTILHGDVKPANILLNDELLPKLSDFGISKLLANDNEHTAHVIGDMSYMDPVYLQTGLLTDKSDVYSFGIVLLELITSKKASHSDKNSLVRNFLDASTNDKAVSDLVDKELAVTEDHQVLLDGVVAMVKQCLNLDVHQRPRMTDIAEGLRDMVKRAQSYK